MKGASESIQDFISWDFEYVSDVAPKNMPRRQKWNYVDYFTEHAEQGFSKFSPPVQAIVKNVYDFFQDEEDRYKLNYNKAVWYFSQNSTDQIEENLSQDQLDAFEFAETVCGMSISYQGKALDTYAGSYHRAIADKSFVVMDKVAM